MAKEFGVNLKRLMGERNLSANKLAKSIGVSPKTVSEWVGANGRFPTKPQHIKKIADIFDVSIHEILFGELDPRDPLAKALEKTEVHTGLYEISIKKVKVTK